MIKLHPHNGTVLCKLLNKKEHQANEKGVVFTKQELPIYEVVEVGDIDSKYNIAVGDKIVSNSEPTKLAVEDETFWLIKHEYIAGKIEE